MSVDFDCPDNSKHGIVSLISELEELKTSKLLSPGADIDFHELDVMTSSFSIYQYHLQCPESYDIFIAKNIPNADTPRVVVQLRSRMLVLEGEKRAIEISFLKVREILNSFNLGEDLVRENRIDYAYHTNIIQDTDAFFNDDYVAEHLRKSLGKITDVKNVRDRRMHYETMNIGQRKSNNIFVRMYNKTKEVIEKNYKSFFFKKWLEDGLISEYDFYCLNKAFEKKSFYTGLLVGRIEWYLEYGKDETLKGELRELQKKCEIKSDNSKFIEKKLKGLLPEITIVTNIEFQTKREFYVSFTKCIKELVYHHDGIPKLEPLFKLLFLRRDFLDYLTTKTVCFVNRDPKNKRKYVMCDWWQRIHRCKVKNNTSSMVDLYRSHDRIADLDRARRQYLRAVARYSMIEKSDLSFRTFEEDQADVLCSLNDNDFYGFMPNPETGAFVELDLNEYKQIQRKVVRQHRSIVLNQGEQKMLRVKILKAKYVTADKAGKKLDNPYCEALIQFDSSTAEKHYINSSKYERPAEIQPGQEFDVYFDRKGEQITYMERVNTQKPN